ncbi:MAG: CD225/dispanin family protein [Alistipes sp.]|nr:CD225/dispanin family protein [Alistipes sp.]
MEANLQKPDNNLVWAILVTIMCCLPFGIVSIIKAASVDNLWIAGKYDEAYQAAADARKWAWIGVGSGLFVVVVYVILLVFVGMAGAMAGLQ